MFDNTYAASLKTTQLKAIWSLDDCDGRTRLCLRWEPSRFARIATFVFLGAFVGLVGFAERSDAVEPAPAEPSCSIPSVSARATLIVHPDYPEGASEEYASREADITVTLSSTGAVEDVTIYKSSGSKSFDRVSLQAARQSVYTPEYADCHAVGGTYLFRSIFGAAQLCARRRSNAASRS